MFKINNNYIFLTRDEINDIKNKVLKFKEPEERAASAIKGTTANKEANRLIIKWLKRNLSDNLVYFNFTDEAARENITDIFLDYSLINKNFHIIDIRNEVDQLIDDYEGIHNYPLGKTLVVSLSKNNILGKRTTECMITINIDEVLSITGKLEDFKMVTNRFTMWFNNKIYIE